MKRNAWLTKALVLTMVCLLALPVAGAEDPAAGAWVLKSDFNGRTVNSLLLISKADSGYRGQWVSFWGMSPVENLKIENGKISFTQTNRFRDQEFSMDFEGTLTNGKLTGEMVSDQWESQYEGSRVKPFEPVIGIWEFRRQRGEREFVNTLTVSRSDDGKLEVDWESNFGRPDADDDEDAWEISDVQYEDGKLSFTRKRTNAERARETTYTLTAEGNTISGTMATSRGEREMEGTRLNGDLVGQWELTVSSDFGERQQLLWVQPDLTAWYGSTPIGKINVEDDTVSFDYEMSFGDRSFENEFTGKLENGTLTGEMSSSQGTQQVKGKKMAAKQ